MRILCRCKNASCSSMKMECVVNDEHWHLNHSSVAPFHTSHSVMFMEEQAPCFPVNQQVGCLHSVSGFILMKQAAHLFKKNLSSERAISNKTTVFLVFQHGHHPSSPTCLKAPSAPDKKCFFQTTPAKDIDLCLSCGDCTGKAYRVRWLWCDVAGDKSSNWLNDCEKKLKTAQCVGYISPVVVVGMSIRSFHLGLYQ